MVVQHQVIRQSAETAAVVQVQKILQPLEAMEQPIPAAAQVAVVITVPPETVAVPVDRELS